MIGCLTETTTCVVAKPLVIDKVINSMITTIGSDASDGENSVSLVSCFLHLSDHLKPIYKDF